MENNIRIVRKNILILNSVAWPKINKFRFITGRTDIRKRPNKIMTDKEENNNLFYKDFNNNKIKKKKKKKKIIP